MPNPTASVLNHISPERILRRATAICEIPSPTRSAHDAANRLAGLLSEAGFKVERPDADWPESPAVVARLESGKPGPCLQFTGHLDTVHLPFVPPTFDGAVLRGSGVSDMKGGLAAAAEAALALAESGALTAGSVLFTAYDHHEGPWGDSRQLHGLIAAGIHGDAALIPEYLADRLPLAGRGLAIFQSTLSRDGVPVHEVFRGACPDLTGAGSAMVLALNELNATLQSRTHPIAGTASCFVGHIASGEIYNQAPSICHVHGTRRWLPGESSEAVRDDFLRRVQEVADRYGATLDAGYRIQRDAFELDPEHALVKSFAASYAEATGGGTLPIGAKPFVDDGNTLWGRARVPAVTHGPAAHGAHTTEEWVPLAELVRVAHVYALTALRFTGSAPA